MQLSAHPNNARKSNEQAVENIVAARAIDAIDKTNLAINDVLKTPSNTIDQGIASAYDAIGILQIAHTSLTQISKNIEKIDELIIKADNANLSVLQKNMLRTEAIRLQEAIDDSFSHANFNGKNVFETMNFLTIHENKSIHHTHGFDIDDASSIKNFMQEIDSLKTEIDSGINAIVLNIHTNIENSIQAKAVENNLPHNDIVKKLEDFNLDYLKENASTFAKVQYQLDLHKKIAILLQ
nr:flagellin [Campylobacter bilis]